MPVCPRSGGGTSVCRRSGVLVVGSREHEIDVQVTVGNGKPVPLGGDRIVAVPHLADQALLDREDGVRVQVGAVCDEHVCGDRPVPGSFGDDVDVGGDGCLSVASRSVPTGPSAGMG